MGRFQTFDALAEVEGLFEDGPYVEADGSEFRHSLGSEVVRKRHERGATTGGVLAINHLMSSKLRSETLVSELLDAP